METAKHYRTYRSLTRKWERRLVDWASYALVAFIGVSPWGQPHLWMYLVRIILAIIIYFGLEQGYPRIAPASLILSNHGLTFEGRDYTFGELDTVAVGPTGNTMFIVLSDEKRSRIYVKFRESQGAHIEEVLKSWADRHGISFRHAEQGFSWRKLYKIRAKCKS